MQFRHEVRSLFRKGVIYVPLPIEGRFIVLAFTLRERQVLGKPQGEVGLCDKSC